MKNVVKTNAKMVKGMIFFIGFYLVSVQQGFAQDLSDFADGVEENADIVFDILRIVLRVILGAGIIGVAYAYVFNNQKAKDNLIYFVIAVVIGGIGSIWLQ